jgi:hypothetical protein
MLTASLQSTWESQKGKQKPRPYQNFTNSEENVKAIFPPQGVTGNMRLDNTNSELPNLRVPQVCLLFKKTDRTKFIDRFIQEDGRWTS